MPKCEAAALCEMQLPLHLCVVLFLWFAWLNRNQLLPRIGHVTVKREPTLYGADGSAGLAARGLSLQQQNVRIAPAEVGRDWGMSSEQQGVEARCPLCT